MTAGDRGLPRLYLIRHGETEWSLSKRHTGRTDIPLTERGEAMARGLARPLRDTAFDLVLTSPLQRARQTCSLAGLGSAAEIEPDLAEWDYGEYEGLTTTDIRRNWPNWNVFRDGCPQGESPVQVSDRADRLLARLREMQGNVALFSHGQFGCALAARWIGVAVIEGQHFSIDAASLSILGPKGDYPEVPVITRWNTVLDEGGGRSRGATGVREWDGRKASPAIGRHESGMKLAPEAP